VHLRLLAARRHAERRSHVAEAIVLSLAFKRRALKTVDLRNNDARDPRPSAGNAHFGGDVSAPIFAS
jgi:hypothetical protein